VRRARALRRRPVRVALVGLAALLGAAPVLTDLGIGAIRPMGWVEGRCRMVRVIAGDTVEMVCSGAGLSRVRLQGYDAPELFSPGCGAERRAALEAKWALRGLFLGAGSSRVRFSGEDRYGRRLAEVWLDGSPLSDLMVEGGHARPYDGGTRPGWCAGAAA